MAVAEQQRPPGATIIDELVAVYVKDVGALTARDEHGIAPHASESPHGRIDAAGNDFLGAAKELFGFGMIHACSLRGTMLLKPKLMPISYRLPLRLRRRRRLSPEYGCLPEKRSWMMAENRGLRRVNCTMRSGTEPNRKRPRKMRPARREPNSRSVAKSRFSKSRYASALAAGAVSARSVRAARSADRMA